MIGLVALTIALSAQAQPATVQAATPPPEIIHVESRGALCETLHKTVAPSIAALLQNDAAIANGAGTFMQMGHDRGDTWFDLDLLHLENDVSKVVRNLEAIDTLLGRPSSAPPTPEENAQIGRLRQALQATADSQNAVLNTMNGTLQSSQASELAGAQQDLLDGIARPDDGERNANANPMMQSLETLVPEPGLQKYGDAPPQAMAPQQTGTDPYAMLARPANGNPYYPLAKDLADKAALTRHYEAALGDLVVETARACEKADAPPAIP